MGRSWGRVRPKRLVRRPKRDYSHAKKRFWERFGLLLTSELAGRLVRKIEAGEVEELERQSNRISVYQMEIEGQEVRVVYDRNRKMIVTALPEEDWR